MGGAALGADVTAAPRRDRARLARRLRRDVRPDPCRAPGGRRGSRRGARARARPVHAGRSAAAQAGSSRSRPPSTGWRWSSSRSPATTGSPSIAWRSSVTGRRTPSTRSRTLRASRRRRGCVTGPDAGPVRRGIPRADDLARAAAGPGAGTGRRRAARRLSGRRPRLPSPSICPTWPTARPSSTGRACASRRASCERARRPVARSATSSRMRSRRISATMLSTSTPGGTRHRDRTRHAPTPPIPRPRRAPTVCPSAPRQRRPPSARRWISHGGSSSWPRTRRRRTSSCSTWPA